MHPDRARAQADEPGRARNAASVLHGERDADATSSTGVLLLRHIQLAFAEAAVDRLATADLLHRLEDNEEGPWGRWWGSELKKDGPPSAAAADLAHKLRPFGPKPRVIRIGDVTPRGYLLDDFSKPFAQYQIAIPPETPATPATPATDESERSEFSSEADAPVVAPVAPVAGGTDRMEQADNGSPHHTCHLCHRPILDLGAGFLDAKSMTFWHREHWLRHIDLNGGELRSEASA